jgi:hypothetical protein
MTALEAVVRLDAREERSVFPAVIVVKYRGEELDAWPDFCAGLAVLSGWLDDAESEADLDAAIRHGLALVASAVVAPEAAERECLAVFKSLLRLGLSLDSVESATGIN